MGLRRRGRRRVRGKNWNVVFVVVIMVGNNVGVVDDDVVIGVIVV